MKICILQTGTASSEELMGLCSEIIPEAEAAASAGDAIILAQPSMTAFLPLLEGLEAPVFSCTRSGIEFLKEFMESGAA